MTESREVDVQVRGLRCRVHCWGDPCGDPLLLLHGWADTGLSFQFLADHMAAQWHLIAPDWRGFGDTDWCPQGYWFPDYLADLDLLLEHFSGSKPAKLVGHSMGGNVAWLYAGCRPERISHAVSLDAYGLRDSDPAQAPQRYRQWLDEWRESPAFSGLSSQDALAARIRKLAPRIGTEQLQFIAQSWIRELQDGTFALKHDPGHKRVNPVLFRRNETRACWRNMTAKTLLVLGRESRFHDAYFNDGFQAECRENLPGLRETVIEDAGHMLHLEQPARLAEILDEFLG